MIINDAALNGLRTGFKKLYEEGFGGVDTTYQDVSEIIPSSSKSNTYGWLKEIPGMREWVGERHINNLSEASYQIVNKDWELTVSVHRNDIEDDNLGVYTVPMKALGRSARKQEDNMVWDMVMAGFTTKCFDGEIFFSGSHPNGSGSSYSNTTSNALSTESYEAARLAMRKYVNEHGENLEIVPNLLVVGPDLEKTARQIVEVTHVVDDSSGTPLLIPNPNYQSAQVLVVPRLAKLPAAWFLLDTSQVVKPFIFQPRKKPEFTALNQPENDRVFMAKEYIFGVDSRNNAGYTFPFLCYGGGVS